MDNLNDKLIKSKFKTQNKWKYKSIISLQMYYESEFIFSELKWGWNNEAGDDCFGIYCVLYSIWNVLSMQADKQLDSHWYWLVKNYFLKE